MRHLSIEEQVHQEQARENNLQARVPGCRRQAQGEALWKRQGERVRFVTNQESVEAARGEASSIFGHLNYLKNAGQLRKWVIVVEEGHRFSQDPNLSVLIEGRKFCRKVVLVTTDYREFSGIAKTFKPKPWEQGIEFGLAKSDVL